MLKLKSQFIFILFFALLLQACSGSKSFYKKGKKLEENGLNIEAANFYIESLRKKKTNEDAIIALKSLGQKVLDEKYGTFYKNYTEERYKDAVYNYIEAEKFKSQVTAVGVQLFSAPYYRDYYEESRDNYITDLYNQAQEQLDKESFQDAESILDEIKSLDPSYKNVKALSDFAFIEPKYRQGLRAYDAREYRQAYFLFKEINDRSAAGYKESIDYMKLSLESAQYAIGILPFENKTKVNGIESGISGSILKDLKDLNDPFLKLVDRTNHDKLLEEQFYNMSDAIDQNTVIETGTMLGTKALLIGKVISAKQEQSSLKKYSRTGWLGKEVKYVNPTTGATQKKLVYSKVYYYEYVQESNVNCTFQYQLISTTTGEVLLSDILEVKVDDEINYATFNGDSRFLVSGQWKSQYRRDVADQRFDSYTQKKALDKKLQSRRELKDVQELTNSLYNQISQKVASEIGNFNPELQ